MNEQQFYREAGAGLRRITINRISPIRPVVPGRSAPQQLARRRRSLPPSLTVRPFSALTSQPSERPTADKNHRRIGPCGKDAKPVIDTVIIEYLYRAPIFVHYGRVRRPVQLYRRGVEGHSEPAGSDDGPYRCVHCRLVRLFLIGFRQSSPARIPFMSTSPSASCCPDAGAYCVTGVRCREFDHRG